MAKSEVAIVVALIALLFGASSVLFYHEPGPANVSCNQANYVNTVGNPSTCAQLPPIGPYNYIINHTGSNYNAYDAEGLLVKQSTDFVTVLNFTMAASGVKVFITAGSYVMAHYVSYSVNNIVLEGAGSATNVSLASSFSPTPLTISGANWLVTQIRFDARNIVTGHSYATLQFTGNNNTVTYSYFNKGDHGQVNIAGTGETAYNNYVTSSTDDGIILRGTRDVAANNFIYKTTNHNCISLVSATESLVQGNTCISSGTYGIALENLGGGANLRARIIGNIISGPVSYGMIVYAASGGVESADDALFSGNTVNGGVNGFYATSGNGLTVEGNSFVSQSQIGIFIFTSPIKNVTINSNRIVSPGRSGMDLENINGLIVSNNIITNFGSTFKGIFLVSDTNFQVTSNVIHMIAGAASGTGLQTASCSQGSIMGNTLTGTGSSVGTGIYLHTSNTDIEVIGNIISTWSTAIKDDASSNDNTIAMNDVRVSIGAAAKISVVGTSDIIIGNIGYNPKGTITTAFDNNAGLNINDTGGGTATPKNATALTNIWSPKTVYITIGAGWTAGHTLVIKVGGTQFLSLAAAIPAGTVYTVYLSPGQTFYCQYQTSQATFVVEGQ